MDKGYDYPGVYELRITGKLRLYDSHPLNRRI